MDQKTRQGLAGQVRNQALLVAARVKAVEGIVREATGPADLRRARVLADEARQALGKVQLYLDLLLIEDRDGSAGA